MKQSLNLRMDADLILRAKAYARREGTSISKLVEAYMESLLKREEGYLTDSIPAISVGDDLDWKKSKKDYLEEKLTQS